MQDSVVAIDLGSKHLRAGFAIQYYGEEEPRLVLPSLVEGTSGQPATAPGAASTSQPTALRCPIQAGRITDFEGLESMLHSAFYGQLGWVLGEEGSVVIAEPILTAKHDREHLTQLMFEVFNVNGMFVQDQAVCSLFAAGKSNGLVIDIGHGKVDIATVTDGLVNTSSAARLPYGGEAMTRYLQHLLAARGIQLRGLHDAEVLKEACARCCSSGADFRVNNSSPAKVLQRQAAQMLKPGSMPVPGTSGSGPQPMAVDGPAAGGPADANGASASQAAPQSLPADPNVYTLPDGSEIRILNEGHAAAEVLFTPELLGLHGTLGIAETAFVVASEPDCLRRGSTLAYSLGNMFICGGGSLLPGVGARLQHDLGQLAPGMSSGLSTLPEYMPVVHSLKHSAWLGAAMLGSFMGSNAGHFISKADYDELGPCGAHRR